MDTQTPITPAPAPRRPRTRLYVALVAAVVALAGIGTTLGLTLGGGSSADPKGVRACQMMLADKRSGLTPDDNRSQQEIMLLTEAKTLDLRNAARQLSSSDMSVQMGAMGNLFTGCAAVGVKLN